MEAADLWAEGPGPGRKPGSRHLWPLLSDGLWKPAREDASLFRSSPVLCQSEAQGCFPLGLPTAGPGGPLTCSPHLPLAPPLLRPTE